MEFISNIKARLAMPLPGEDAQYKMASGIRQTHRPIPENARIACVLALLYPKKEQWHIVLIQRKSTNINDRHKGQISFPGGKLEDTDKSLEAGALRETEEEVGVNAKQIKILGQLTKLYIPVSNFLVYPFVGFSTTLPKFKAQQSEVKEIIEVPLEHLTDPAVISKTDIQIEKSLILKRVPFYNLNNKVVWGATAMMLSEFLEIIQSAHNN